MLILVSIPKGSKVTFAEWNDLSIIVKCENSILRLCIVQDESISVPVRQQNVAQGLYNVNLPAVSTINLIKTVSIKWHQRERK